jgi:hypothetical protein
VIASTDESGIVTLDELGESETFSIGSTTGIGDRDELTFAIQGVHPNPAVGGLRIRFSLPDARPARLVVYDVAGRRVVEREVSQLGPGLHSVKLDTRGLAAGVYMVRLNQAGRSLTARAIVLD